MVAAPGTDTLGPFGATCQARDQSAKFGVKDSKKTARTSVTNGQLFCALTYTAFEPKSQMTKAYPQKVRAFFR